MIGFWALLEMQPFQSWFLENENGHQKWWQANPLIPEV